MYQTFSDDERRDLENVIEDQKGEIALLEARIRFLEARVKQLEGRRRGD